LGIRRRGRTGLPVGFAAANRGIAMLRYEVLERPEILFENLGQKSGREVAPTKLGVAGWRFGMILRTRIPLAPEDETPRSGALCRLILDVGPWRAIGPPLGGAGLFLKSIAKEMGAFNRQHRRSMSPAV